MINTITVKDIVDENFQDYKKTSLFIATCKCNWKCCTDCGCDITMCQNSSIAKQPNITINNSEIVKRYLDNPITSAIVIGGLEPFLQFDEVYSLIDYFRSHGCNDPFVIYTGYYKDEIRDGVEKLAQFPNIIIKFGRYIPGQEKHLDDVLGVELASDNQYAEKIS